MESDLRNVLASALHETDSEKGYFVDDYYPWVDRVLALPSFREGLAESVANGLRGYRHGRYGVEKGTREGRVQVGEREFARSIADRMLGEADGSGHE